MPEQNDRLVPLQQLEGGLAEGEQDVEGWHVLTADGTHVGCVARVLADADARTLRFLEVEPDEDVAADGDDRPIVLSVSEVRFFEEGETVLLPHLLGDDIAGLPRREA